MLPLWFWLQFGRGHMFIEYTPLEVEVFILSLNSPLLKCLTALKLETGTSLVGQCLRLHLRIRGLRIQSLVRELRSKKTKTENRSNIVTNSIKTLKTVHIKKKNLKQEQNKQKTLETDKTDPSTELA